MFLRPWKRPNSHHGCLQVGNYVSHKLSASLKLQSPICENCLSEIPTYDLLVLNLKCMFSRTGIKLWMVENKWSKIQGWNLVANYSKFSQPSIVLILWSYYITNKVLPSKSWTKWCHVRQLRNQKSYIKRKIGKFRQQLRQVNTVQ